VTRTDLSPEDDPRSFIEAPVIAALNGIVARALIGLSVVAASATLPVILGLDVRHDHRFHFFLPAAWVVYAALTATILILRPPPREADVWDRAAEVDASLARFARWTSTLMMAGWAASVAVALVQHHLVSPRDVLVTLGIVVPLTLAAWVLAVFAWNAWCRASLARAEHDAADRLRRYWARAVHQREVR
jgi:hypothetical protein